MGSVMRRLPPGHRLFMWYGSRGLAAGFLVGLAAGSAVVAAVARHRLSGTA